MPPAPNLIVTRASVGVSALVRTPISRYLSAQDIRVVKSPLSSGLMSFTSPSITSPVAPSRVMKSPRWTLKSLAKK